MPRRTRAKTLAWTCLLLVGTLAEPLSGQQQPLTRTPQGGVNLNYQDADLAYIFSSLAQVAGVNIMYSNLPARPITLRTSVPVPVSELISLIYSLATANGVTVAEGNGFIRLQGGAEGQAPDLRQLFIYRLRHTVAPDLAQTLQALFGIATVGNRPQTTGAQTLNQQIQQMQQQQGAVRPPVQQPQIVLGGLPAALQGSVLIVPDVVTNSLLIRATPADYQIIQQAVQALDLRPLQVLIEVVIAEVRRSNDLNVGVQFGGQNTGGGGLDSLGIGSIRTADDFIVRFVRNGEVNVQATLSALARNGNVRILSRPVVQAQNNQEAKISVGEQRPFVAVSRSFATEQSVRDDVVNYREVATTLTITPTINPDGYVNLVISQEVNNASNELQFGAPVITTRSAVTQLLARDGQTIVIGGLIDNQEERTRSGIPYLRDIPLIGWLFGGLRKVNINAEMFLFLTPHIVETDADADRIRRELEQNAEGLGKITPINPLIRPIQRPDTIRR